MNIPTHRANAVQVEQTAPLEYTVTLGFADRATLKVILGAAQARNLWIELTGAMPEEREV